MPKHDIVIIASDPSTNQLTLRDGPTTDALRGDTIIWSINDPNVASIQIIKKHFLTHNIFINPPGNQSTPRVDAYIEKDLWFNWNYKYSIVWTDQAQQTHTYDPVISIKPNPKFFFTPLIVLSIVAIVVMLGLRLAFRSFKKKNNANAAKYK